MRYGIYTVETRGNGFTALVKRDADGAEVFMQGEDAIEFLDQIELYGKNDLSPIEYIEDYFLGIDEVGGWEVYKDVNGLN